jgi:hypothetical protein
MPDSTAMTAYLTAAQLCVVVASVVYLALQVHGERVAAGFQAYSQVNDAYMRHLWLASENPELDSVWEPWDEVRRAELDIAQRGGKWGAWHAMTLEEKRCYRYTRAALEIFEQAWEVRRQRMIGEDTWLKWEDWLREWTDTRYFVDVFVDSRPRLLKAFRETVDGVMAQKSGRHGKRRALVAGRRRGTPG